MSGLERITSHRTATKGAPFSQIVLDERYAFVSGVVAADLPDAHAVRGNVARETRAVLSTIRDMLADIGIGMQRVVRVDVHLADLDDFDAMNAAYRGFFHADALPARTTTESRRLFGDSRVEITVIARRD